MRGGGEEKGGYKYREEDYLPYLKAFSEDETGEVTFSSVPAFSMAVLSIKNV